MTEGIDGAGEERSAGNEGLAHGTSPSSKLGGRVSRSTIRIPTGQLGLPPSAGAVANQPGSGALVAKTELELPIVSLKGSYCVKQPAPAPSDQPSTPQPVAQPYLKETLKMKALSRTSPQSDEQHKDYKSVAKTMLDHSILFDQVAKSAQRFEDKVAQEVKERSSTPGKALPSITEFKPAAACPAVWDGSDPKERFRFCGTCKQIVYDFKGLDYAEAQELIFTRESRRNAPLFKRADGKFLTADCPVGKQQQQKKIVIIVAGSLIAVAAVAFLLLMPHPPQPTVVDQPTPVDSSPTTADVAPPQTETPAPPAAAPAATIFQQPAVPTQPTAIPDSTASSARPIDQTKYNDESKVWQYGEVEPTGSAPTPAPAADTAPPAGEPGQAPTSEPQPVPPPSRTRPTTPQPPAADESENPPASDSSQPEN